MSIKTKIIILAVFSLVVTATIGLILFQNSLTVKKEIEKQGIISEIQNKLFEKTVLRNEYFLYREERPIVQLQIESEALEKLLIQVSSIETSADERILISRLSDNIKSIEKTLSQIVVNFKTEISSPSANANELEQRLTSQLLVRAQENFAISSQLSETSRNKVAESQQKATFFVLVFVVGIILIIIFVLYFIWLSIAKPLIKLKESALRIAALDFSSTTTTTTTTTTGSNDEIGQLARAFNTMVEKLKSSYEILEQKVRDRTQDLEEAKAKDEAILLSIGDAVMACDKNGEVMLFNRMAEKLTGFSVKEVTSQHYSQALKFVRESDGKTGDDFIAEAITTGHATKMVNHTLLIRKNGQKVPVADSAAPLKNMNGSTIGCVVVFRDVSKEREAEKLRTDFLSLASHQLRTPLSGIKWLIETMQRKVLGPVTERQKEYLGEIYNVNEQMIKLVSDMLNVLRFESGAAMVKKGAVSMTDSYKELIAVMDPAAKSKGIILRNVLKNHKTVVVESDATMLRSILECFVSNAINYSESGQEVILDMKEESTAFTFSVKDLGIGIPREEQERIFTRFYRGSNAKRIKPDGTGLGLYIASILAEKIGAEILFESEEGKGTTFYLRVPKGKTVDKDKNL